MTRLQQLTCALAGIGLSTISTAHAADWPAPIKAVEARGAKVVGTFDAPGGLKGYAARYNGQGMTLYLTPDGEHVLIGSLLDAQGADVGQQALEQYVFAPMGKEMWERMEKSAWIADGSPKAPRIVYLFSDPNCPYCNLFWQQARPWVESGKVQLRHIMVGMLRPDSPGKAAALLGAKDPQAALNAHEAAGKGSTLKAADKVPGEIRKNLAENLDLMGEMGAQATPSVFYLDDKGRLQQQQGVPQPDVMARIMGSQAE
ncbi:thiol:disulfide interchange protein DsbG [Pseudomonas taiwanensis]|uniref:thiol:disulfide interchange protein DsbG n=1 Tax=Pseudomonas taiwanensis TaxID=470150 RepID=UPI0015BABF9D|nr:thiol:disulfide interchange protein DsbG [Pseudomonas taiwanensis]NWL77046.1 thiol:disulfide interchange protein DsbG [Pseudomonas taiwanensis]